MASHALAQELMQDEACMRRLGRKQSRVRHSILTLVEEFMGEQVKQTVYDSLVEIKNHVHGRREL